MGDGEAGGRRERLGNTPDRRQRVGRAAAGAQLRAETCSGAGGGRASAGTPFTDAGRKPVQRCEGASFQLKKSNFQFFCSKDVPRLVWHSRKCVPLGSLIFLFAPTAALATLTLWLLTCASSFLAPSLHVIFPTPRGTPPQNLRDLQVHVIYISV